MEITTFGILHGENGDNDPSLCVTNTQITDFGDEEFRGQDIFNFISKCNNISNQKALEYVINNYNVDTTFLNALVPTNSRFTQNTKITPNKKVTYKLIPAQGQTEEIYAMFDNVSYSEKPVGVEIGKIKNRIDTKLEPLTYTLEETKNCFIQGKTCIPAGIKKQEDWQDDENFLQIFMVDIDNVKTVNGVKQKITADSEEHITVEKIVKYCEEINLLPTFIYYTFSHSEQQHKFRLVYILEVGTQKQEEIKGIYDFLKDTFKEYNIDTAPTSIATMFFGGKTIAYSSNIFYTIEQTEKAEPEIIENYKIQPFCNFLEGSPYWISNGTLGMIKNDKFAPISNFITYITEKCNYINDSDTFTTYTINCILLNDINRELPPLKITTEQYNKYNFVLGSCWDKYAIIRAGTSNPEKLREVTQLLSRHTMTEKNIYTKTGFERIDNHLVYLYHSGVIGDVENVEVDLSRERLERFCFTDKEFDLQESLERSLSFLEVADKKITIPFLATIYLAPLFSLLSENNINADYILFIQGRTGTRKSSLTALALCHYGIFDRDHFPSSFRDTLNSIEKTAYTLKDAPNVVDDFNPEIDRQTKNSKYGKTICYVWR